VDQQLAKITMARVVMVSLHLLLGQALLMQAAAAVEVSLKALTTQQAAQGVQAAAAQVELELIHPEMELMELQILAAAAALRVALEVQVQVERQGQVVQV
jgi:hypothetical protein